MNKIKKIILPKILFFCFVGLSPQTQAGDDEPIHGSIALLLGFAPLSETFQYIGENRYVQPPTSEHGYGFMLDIGSDSGNAFALDYYFFTEDAYRTSDNPNSITQEKISLSGVLLGYRYHYPQGFYTGIGFWYPQVQGEKALNNGVANSRTSYQAEPLIALTFGHNVILKSGFTIGVNLFYSLPATLERDTISIDGSLGSTSDPRAETGELHGVQVTSFAFKLGYSWY